MLVVILIAVIGLGFVLNAIRTDIALKPIKEEVRTVSENLEDLTEVVSSNKEESDNKLAKMTVLMDEISTDIRGLKEKKIKKPVKLADINNWDGE